MLWAIARNRDEMPDADRGPSIPLSGKLHGRDDPVGGLSDAAIGLVGYWRVPERRDEPQKRCEKSEQSTHVVEDTNHMLKVVKTQDESEGRSLAQKAGRRFNVPSTKTLIPSKHVRLLASRARTWAAV